MEPLTGIERVWGVGPAYIIAEVSANHHHKFEEALEIVRAAKEAGADAVKVQTYTPDTLTLDCREEWFQIHGGTPWDGRTLYDLYSEASMPWDWQPRLQQAAAGLGLEFFSSAFDATAVAFLETLNVRAHKIASFEIVDIPLIRTMAATGKPLVISTGMATLGEIEEAVTAARQAGAKKIALLKCTSAYPATPEEANLTVIPHLRRTFRTPAGISDHTRGIEVPVAAVALGARIVEKHLTLSRAAGGPDASFSLEPSEFHQMALAVRRTEAALGALRYGVTAGEKISLSHRRSLFAVREIRAGETFSGQNVRSIRPAAGLHPRHLDDVLERVAATDIPRGTPLEWRHVAEKTRTARL